MSNSNLHAPYGIFPYIIYKVNSLAMMAIPVHFNNEKNPEVYPGIHCEVLNKTHACFDPLLDGDVVQQLILKTRALRKSISMDHKKKARVCLVLSPELCVYFEENQEIKSTHIPKASTLINPRGRVLGIAKSNHQVPISFESY